MALHPDGSKLYVPEPGALKVFDAASGVLLKQIDMPYASPAGICFGQAR